MKVKKKYLLIIASVVWLVAGFNVLRIGTQTYQQHLSLLNYLLKTDVTRYRAIVKSLGLRK